MTGVPMKGLLFQKRDSVAKRRDYSQKFTINDNPTIRGFKMLNSQKIRMNLLGIRMGRELPRLYSLYNQSQYWDDEEMSAFQNNRLRTLFAHCLQNSPFYARMLRVAGINPDSASIQDLKKLPICEKGDLKQNHKDITAKNLHELPLIKRGTTGGTTGEPLVVFSDANRRASTSAALYRYFDWIGVSLASSKLRVWGQPIVKRSGIKKIRRNISDYISNFNDLDAFKIAEKYFEEYVAAFKKHKPSLLRGYTQSLYELALILKKHGFQYPLRGVSCTVEPLFEQYRQLFREVFSCEAFDQYGCGECNSIAFECEHHQGLHVARENCLLEVDENGAAIITDLNNRAFPIIRYKPGDNLVVSTEPCSCGRPGPIIKKIFGRTGDVVIGADGMKLHPEFFTHLINEASISGKQRIRKYQVRQDAIGHLSWIIEIDAMAEKDISILHEHLRRYLINTEIKISISKEIPRESSGKFRYVISNVH